MNKLARVLLLPLLFLGFAPTALGAAKTEVSLILSHTVARPGETITAALRTVSEEGWHTYWRNFGDAGMPPVIEWDLPPGLAAGAIAWPVPEKMVLARLYAYVYEGETLLLIPITVASNAPPGTVRLKGAVEWLECDDKTCVPASGSVQGSLTIGPVSQLSEHAAKMDLWRGRLPGTNAPFSVSAAWEGGSGDYRKLVIEWVPGTPVDNPDFYPYENSTAVSAETEIIEASPEKVRLRKTVRSDEGKWPAQIQGIVLNSARGKHPAAFEVSLSLPPPPGGSAGTARPAGAPVSLLAVLGLAFLGGLILNVMPCVLPVIALKILGFVQQSREEPKRVRELGIIYMLGVLASFLVLAGGLLAARQAAGDVNWGMQMQNPYFVVGMLVLVTLVALNLWGVFEITLPGQALGAAGQLASREGRSGAFYNGVLATLLATPCTAPALGIAVGAVLTRPAHIVILTFAVIGLGLAFPYVLLSWNPRWLKLLPKPGAWMEKFKIAMGFPMAATAVWLWSFGGRHFGKSGGLWLGLFLVFLALGAWVYGDFVQRGRTRRGWAGALALFIVVFGYAWTLEAKLHWRNPPAGGAASDPLSVEPGGIPWKRWSPEAVAQARAEGRPVLVDFTADWCFTCQVNKVNAIEVEPVKTKLREINAAAFLADFTLRDPLIGAEIRRLGRAGVPLVVVYPPDPSAEPVFLPDGLFTSGTLLEALDLAARRAASP